MKLVDLIADLETDQLDRLAAEHISTDEPVTRSTLCSLLEGSLRSFQFIQTFVVDRQPPAFSIFTTLLDAPEYAVPAEGFRERVMAETARISTLVSTGELLGDESSLRLYRRVLREARRNDLKIDASESAILGVLRKELEIPLVEHFLLEHHAELHEFWNGDTCFLHELHALRSAGLIFVREGMTLIAEDVAPLIRQAVGIEMPSDHARRLFAKFTSVDLSAVLAESHVNVSGTKEEKADRLLLHMVQPRFALRLLSLQALRELCRDSGLSISGLKDELVERVAASFAKGHFGDEEALPEVQVIVAEPKQLERATFTRIFACLRGGELAAILAAFPELRQSGSKDARVSTLWESAFSESTLLGKLTQRDLEDVLHRLDLRLSGTKRERIERILEFARSAGAETMASRRTETGETVAPPSATVEAFPVEADKGADIAPASSFIPASPSATPAETSNDP